jgi:hypothetical protein
MLASDQPFLIRHRLLQLPAALFALALSASSFATEGGFIGAYTGISSSLDADKTSSSFKILTGAHVTSRISLEFAYINFGATSYNDPTAINVDTSNSNISFKDASHGTISHGQLGDSVPDVNGRNTYTNKGSSSFSGISEFTPEGGLINLRYRFPILDNLDFFVKTGFFAWVADYKTIKITADKDGKIVRTDEKDSQTSAVNAISGGGFIYFPIPELSLRAELESTAISSGEMPRTRLQNISFGANWEF